MRGRTKTTTLMLAAGMTLGLAGAGCETVQDNPRTSGALIGAGGGALAGSQIAGKGNKTEGAAIGAAAGAAGGWLIGNEVDKNNDENNDSRRAQQARARERARDYDDDYYYRRDSEYRRYD